MCIAVETGEIIAASISTVRAPDSWASKNKHAETERRVNSKGSPGMLVEIAKEDDAYMMRMKLDPASSSSYNTLSPLTSNSSSNIPADPLELALFFSRDILIYHIYRWPVWSPVSLGTKWFSKANMIIAKLTMVLCVVLEYSTML